MSGEIEILPPEMPGILKPTVRDLVEGGDTLPERPLSLLPSGRWWVFIPGAGECSTMVNDHQLYWPRGTWFAVEDKHFHVLMDTDFPMQWYDGWDLYEKTFETRTSGRSGIPYRLASKRLLRAGVQPMSDPTYDGRRASPKALPGS